jgi:hypothetical protein
MFRKSRRGGHTGRTPTMFTFAWTRRGLRQQRSGASRLARVGQVACPRWLPQGPSHVHAGSGRAGGDRTPSGWQAAVDTSMATYAEHRLSGRRSFRKQRTVNPLLLRPVTTSSTNTGVLRQLLTPNQERQEHGSSTNSPLFG